MISDYQFGRLTINGQSFDYDIFIDLTGKIHSWWREESHWIDKEDIVAGVEQKPEILIIGTGAYGVAKVADKTKKYCSQNKIKLIIKPTSEAVEEYNQLKRDNQKVAACFHLTC